MNEHPMEGTMMETRTMIPAATLDALVTERLGHYNGDVAWRLRHGIDNAEQLAHSIADRDSRAVCRLASVETCYVCDHAVWWPALVAACAELQAEVDALVVEAPED